jgi:hypothetical protein
MGDLLVLIAFPTAWLAIGLVLVNRAGLTDELLGRGVLATTLGFGAHALWMATALLLGLPALGASLAYLGLGGIAVIVARSEVARTARRVRETWRSASRRERIVLAGFALFLGLALLAAFAPPTGHDALVYHLPEVREYLETDSVVPIAHLKQTYLPKNAEVVYVAACALGSWSAAQVVHGLLGVLLLVATGRLAARLGGRAAGYVAALATLSVHAFFYEMSTADVDLATGLLVVVGTTQTLRVLRNGRLRDATCAGVLGGLAVGTKLLAFGPVGIHGILILGALLARRPRRRAILAAAAFGTVALATYLPWIVRNHRDLEAPLFPVQSVRIEEPPAGLPRRADTYGLAWRMWKTNELYPLRRLAPPTALFRATFHPPGEKSPLQPAFLAFVPLGLLTLWLGVHERRRELAWLALVAVASLVFWVKTYPVIRYALGPLALASPILAIGFLGMVRARWPIRAVAVLSLAFLVLPPLAKSARNLTLTARGAVSSGESRERYLRGRIPSYSLVGDARRAVPSGRVLTSDRRAFYFGRSAEPAGDWNASWVLPDSPEAWSGWLRWRRIGHVLVARYMPGVFADPDLLRAFRDTPGVRLLLENERGEIYAYEPLASAPSR